MNTATNRSSGALFRRARRVIPGGVNSPVRAFSSVGALPRFIRKARGPFLWDADGNRFIDFVGSWGPMILGHAHPAIVKAVRSSAAGGTSFGAPTETEVLIAEKICSMVPSIDIVRMVNSGTEATMSAIRLARAFTRRNGIIKFDGCYHGHADSFLIRAGSGAATLGIPNSPGVTPGTAGDTFVAAFNDIRSVASLMKRHRRKIAAVIVEPVVGNMGCIPPAPGFLESLRELCTKEKVLLIFDEVMTGFRLAPGGAQEYYRIRPDLTTMGKIIGGGLPVGAYGGRADIMKLIAPAGPVYQAGTLSGNPLAMAAGLEMLLLLTKQPSPYRLLEQRSRLLEDGMRGNLDSAGIPYRLNRVGSMFTLFFTDADVVDAASARKADTRLFARYFREMLQRGIYLPPSQFEAAFISTAHGVREIEQTLAAQRSSLRAITGSRSR